MNNNLDILNSGPREGIFRLGGLGFMQGNSIFQNLNSMGKNI